MGESKEFMKGNALGVLARVAGWLLAFGHCAAILFPVFAVPGHGHRPSCVSHLKQVTLSVIMYASDADDRLPPFFSFDGEESTKQFMKVTMDYCKNEQIFICPKDKGYPDENLAGPYKKMSYVHPLALKRIIPDFYKGNRVVALIDNSIPNLETTVYLRDPIRHDPKIEDNTIHSPHEEGFNVSYLDGHAKRIEHLNVNTEL
jgi:prepilin-type processing-associated H-X9-DG protein